MKKIALFVLLSILALNQKAFSFSDTMDTATPAGSDSPTQGDDRIRELKRGLVERLQVDHIWPASGTTYDGATVGYHKAVRLAEQGSAPSTPASYGAIYTKDSGTQPELFFREESDGDEVQLTSNGALKDVPVIPRAVWRNLKVVRDSATQVTVTADELVLQNSAGGISYDALSVNESIAITTSGISGLDTGVEAGNTLYYIWILRKSSDGTVNGAISTSTTLSTVLSNVGASYDQGALVSVVGNDNSSNFISFTQEGDIYYFSSAISIGTDNTSAWVSVDLTPATLTFFVPTSLSTHAFGTIYEASTARISNKASPSNGEIVDSSSSGLTGSNQWDFHILTTDSLWIFSDSNSNSFYIRGFVLNKLD